MGSALGPGQSGKTPATDLAAVAVGILVALKAFQDVVGVGIARAGSQGGRCVGAGTAAAQEHHQGLWIDLSLELGEEMGVGLVARVGQPFEFNGARYPANPVPLGAGAYIHQAGRAAGGLEHFPGFAGCQGPGIGQIGSPGPFLGKGESLAEDSHNKHPARMANPRVYLCPPGLQAMSVDPSPIPAEPPLEGARAREAQRATWVSVGTNLVLTVLQIVVGLLAHAQSLVADGMHTLSDLLGDFLVMYASRHGAVPADERHPYGHGRYETAASMVLGLVLAGVGAGFLVTAAGRLQTLDALPEIHPMALWMSLLTLAAKEGLFRFMMAVAERLRSPMLVANAWHARADAASSLVVAVGIGGSLLGYRFLEPLAAALVGFMILRMGLMLAYEALGELIDTGIPPEEAGAMRETVLHTSGVLGVHELRTRRMAHRILVDVHVRVPARISVSEGHRVAELVRQRLCAAHADVLDVLVHVDSDEDERSAQAPALPDRTQLEQELRLALGLSGPMPVVLHYLGDRVDAELILPPEILFDPVEKARLLERVRTLKGLHPHFGEVALGCRIAP